MRRRAASWRHLTRRSNLFALQSRLNLPKSRQTLGRYKLLERVGEGGCGVVHVAEQTEPVRRRVALKVIKLGNPNREEL